MSEDVLKDIATKYFDEHREAKDGVLKAYYAYHAPHFRLTIHGHNFTSGDLESCCVWCGRSRMLVRWDDLPAECQSRPPDVEIAEVVLSEEEKYFALLEKAKTEVPKLIKRGVSMEQLYQTYGYDEETVKSCQA